MLAGATTVAYDAGNAFTGGPGGFNAPQFEAQRHGPGPLRIAIVTDAWLPQTNGVVRTLMSLREELESLGHAIIMVTPQDFVTIPCPTYSEIRLALTTPGRIGRALDKIAPDAIHIVTEGPLGIAARAYCQRRKLTFTTSFHTKFPDYIAARWGIPAAWTYAALRWFHSASAATMVATESVRLELASHGFDNLRSWTRGVDLQHFRPAPKPATDWPRPIFLFVGRVAVEKNLAAFLDLDLPGTKVVVGDGLVLLEALASGVPIAAFPVSGPLDLIGNSGVGVLSEDLRGAALAALSIDPEACRARAAEFTWRNSAQQFLHNLHLIR